jgi:hypothetical protein
MNEAMGAGNPRYHSINQERSNSVRDQNWKYPARVGKKDPAQLIAVGKGFPSQALRCPFIVHLFNARNRGRERNRGNLRSSGGERGRIRSGLSLTLSTGQDNMLNY